MATAITVVCPHCNHRMRASTEHIGRKGRCPSCKSLVEIKAPLGEESMVTLHPTATAGLPRHADVRLSSTDVPAWLAGAIGAGVTAALYLAIFLPLRGKGFWLPDLFADRGPMQYCITLVVCWGLSLLLLKYLAVKKQLSYAELELELIPLEIGLQITPSNVDQFLGHLCQLTFAERLSILGRRIQGALEHFKSRNSVPEVQEYLAKQADLDASGVDSGYSLLRTFIWVIPLLGFVGTVVGISAAIAGLQNSLGGSSPPAATRGAEDQNAPPASSAPNSDQLMKGLHETTAGLSTAFDATLLALVMAIVLVFPVETLRKIEYRMLDRIEAFTNESLLRRMAEERTAYQHEKLPEVVRDALDAAFQEHQRWLAQWQAQVGQLGQAIGNDFEAVAARVQEQMGRNEAARVQKMEEMNRVLGDIFRNAQDATATWQRSQQGMASQVQAVQQAAGQLQQSFAENSRFICELAQQQHQMVSQYSQGDFQRAIVELAAQVGRFTHWLDGAGAPGGDGQARAAAPVVPQNPPPAMPFNPPPAMPAFSPVAMPLNPPALPAYSPAARSPNPSPAAPAGPAEAVALDEVSLLPDSPAEPANTALWRRLFKRS
jgi:biopolymer transport protein ExbB/TolQ/phage FluMu protein Com